VFITEIFLAGSAGQFDRADQAVGHLLRMMPDWPLAHEQAAINLWTEGKYPQAIAEWREEIRLKRTAEGLSALAAADVNGDGRLDLIAGNVGLNTKYAASAEAPAVVFAGDLDGSGREAILEAGYDADGRLYPLRGRSTLATSFPWLRQKFPTFADFSRAPVDKIFSPERLRAATRLTATELASGIFLQQADGTFRFSPLPRAAQLAPINGFVFADLDGDGLPEHHRCRQ